MLKRLVKKGSKKAKRDYEIAFAEESKPKVCEVTWPLETASGPFINNE